MPLCGGLPDGVGGGGCGGGGVGRGRGRLTAAANSFKIHCHLGVGWKEERRGEERRGGALSDSDAPYSADLSRTAAGD